MQVHVAGSLRQRKFKVGNGNAERTVSKIEIRVSSVAPLLSITKESQAPIAPTAAAPQPA